MSPDTSFIKVMAPALEAFFHMEEILEFSDVRAAGYMCRNYIVRTEKDAYFLKQYRTHTQPTVAEIKEAEQFFARHEFPVVLPLPTRAGDPAFQVEDNWFSLFPYVQGFSPRASELTPAMIASLATMLGRMHRAGIEDKPVHYAPIRLWNRSDFFRSLSRLEQVLSTQETVSPMQKFALNSLRIQAEYLETHREAPEDFPLPHNCLLHGDFIYTNVFFNQENQVNAIFDFERTGVGPRAYELARSIFLTCFDDGWEPYNEELARVFLASYLASLPMTREEFLQGARMYAQHFMHMTWLETKVIEEASGPHIALLMPARRRTVRFAEGVDSIVEKIWHA